MRRTATCCHQPFHSLENNKLADFARWYLQRNSGLYGPQKWSRHFPHGSHGNTSESGKTSRGYFPNCSESWFKIHLSWRVLRFQKRASLIVNEERQIYATFGMAEFHQSHERKRRRHRLTSSPITKMACGVAFHGEEKLTATSTGCAKSAWHFHWF